MAISMFNNTIILMTEYEPNINRAQKRVKLLMPVKSNAVKSTSPKLAQNNDCEVSNKLKQKLYYKLNKIVWFIQFQNIT